jgi:hypothetical protein
MGNSHRNLLFRNHWVNSNQTLMEWSLDSPLPKLCPVIPTFNQDVRQAKNRKKGEWNLKKIFSSEGPFKDHSTKVWLQLVQWFLRRRFLCEFPIGFYVKLSSAVGSILFEGPNRRTYFWTWTIQWLLKQMFSETTEPISTKLCWDDPFQNWIWHFSPPTEMAATAELNLT